MDSPLLSASTTSASTRIAKSSTVMIAYLLKSRR
jgi:hypothetical protein